LDLILIIAEVFHKQGLNKKEEIFNTLTKLKDLENIQKQINYLRQVHSKLVKQIIGLHSQEKNIKKILEFVMLGMNIFYYTKEG
jgi:hypothetical protein